MFTNSGGQPLRLSFLDLAALSTARAPITNRLRR